MQTQTSSGTISVTDLFSTSFPALTIDPTRVDADRARLVRQLRHDVRRNHAKLDETDVVACSVRPFDVRWSVAADERDRATREQLAASTDWLAIDTRGIGDPFTSRNAIAGSHLRLFPMHCLAGDGRSPNLTREARQHAIRHSLGETELFHHTVAVLAAHPHSAMRIPLPESKELVRSSAVLGYRLASLYGEPSTIALRRDDQELRFIGVPTRVGKEARMLRGSVLALNEWWDREGRIVTREYDDDELVAISDHARTANMTTSEVIDLLGARTVDVYLNEKAYWRNVPQHIWNYAYAESPVLRSWLRGRTQNAIGRALVRDEVSQFASASRRIAALLLLAPALARNYAALS